MSYQRVGIKQNVGKNVGPGVFLAHPMPDCGLCGSDRGSCSGEHDGGPNGGRWNAPQVRAFGRLGVRHHHGSLRCHGINPAFAEIALCDGPFPICIASERIPYKVWRIIVSDVSTETVVVGKDS